MSRPKIPAQWSSERLLFSNAIPADVADLQRIYDACHYVRVWEGKGAETRDMLKVITQPELPPDGEAQYVHQQTIRQQEDGQVVGYLEMYYGYPKPDVYWIALFYVHPDFQQKGYGNEAIRALLQQVRALHFYTEAQLAVGIKNWIGMRFWQQQGFDKLLRWRGDKVYGEDKFAMLVFGAVL